MSEFHPDDQYIYLGYINGSHKVRNKRTGKTYNADKITTGGIPLSAVVKFLGKKIDSQPYRKTEIPDTPGYSFIGEVVAISPYPITKPDIDPENLARIGGHIPSPLKTIADTSEPKVSKTGNNKNEWISGNQFGNYYWDKTTKEFKAYSFYAEGLISPSNPADKIPYDLFWNGYGYLMGEWRKLDPITTVSTTSVSGLFTTTTTSETCPVEIVEIRLNQKFRYPGTYSQSLVVVQKKPGDPNYDPDNPNPYVSPPPACFPVCVPTGKVESLIGRWTVPYPIDVTTQRANRPLLIEPFTPNPTRSQISAAYSAKYSGLGPVSSGDSYSTANPGGTPIFLVKYTAQSIYREENCTCEPAPTPPPPPPPPDTPPSPPPPNPPGLTRTETKTLLLEILNITMKPGLVRRIRWEENSVRNTTDGVENSKTQNRDIDCWFPLVKNEKGDAVICLQLYQVSTVANPSAIEVRFWYSAPGSTSLVSLNRTIFEPIFFKNIEVEVQNTLVNIPLDQIIDANFSIRERLKPTPDLITLEGKDPYLARIVYPDLDDPEAIQPDVKDAMMDLEMWAIPSGTKTTKKVKVKSLKIVKNGAIPHYSYYPKAL